MNTGDIVLDAWQEDILKEEGNILLCTGRQVGKTTIFAIKIAEYLMEHPRSRIIVVSLTEDQAKLIIVMTLDYLEKHYKSEIAKGKDKPVQGKITLKNKSYVLSRPVGQTGDSIRGFTGDVLVIDEAARMPELAFTAARPVLLTTAGKIWMSSTPHGKQGFFWESFQNKNNRFRVFHINSEEVMEKREISGNWTEHKRAESLKFLEEEKASMSQLQYGQEYLGLFLEELQQYFPDDVIAKSCVLRRPELIMRENNFIGVDIARMGGDESVFSVLNSTAGKKVHQVESVIKKKQFTTKTEEDILYLNELWNPIKIGIDAGSGSLGVGIFDRLMANPKTKRKVVAMNNRTIIIDAKKGQSQRIFKEDMYDNLLSMMEKGEILLLSDDEIMASLKSIQWELAERGSVSKVRIFGNYSHCAESIMRAAWLCKKEKINKVWISYC